MCTSGRKKKLSAAKFGIFAKIEEKISEFVIFLVILYTSTEYNIITEIYTKYEDKANAIGSYPVSNCGSK
jgi:hypothetical protein